MLRVAYGYIHTPLHTHAYPYPLPTHHPVVPSPPMSEGTTTHHLSPRTQVIRSIRALRLVNPLHTYQQVLLEWRYITAFISNSLHMMSKQVVIDNILTPTLDLKAIHIRTERQVGIHTTPKSLSSLDDDNRNAILKDIHRRRMRAYNIFLRTTSTREFMK